jgi:hypothetical protein
MLFSQHVNSFTELRLFSRESARDFCKTEGGRCWVKTDPRVIRVSPSINNNAADVDKLPEALA